MPLNPDLHLILNRSLKKYLDLNEVDQNALTHFVAGFMACAEEFELEREKHQMEMEALNLRAQQNMGRLMSVIAELRSLNESKAVAK